VVVLCCDNYQRLFHNSPTTAYTFYSLIS
jgi:hypothetical protein